MTQSDAPTLLPNYGRRVKRGGNLCPFITIVSTFINLNTFFTYQHTIMLIVLGLLTEGHFYLLKIRKKRKGFMFKRLFQRPPTAFFPAVCRASFVVISTMLLFSLFFMGNGHTLAKMPKLMQPSLLTTGSNNASARSSGQLSLRVSAFPTIRLKPTSGFVGTSTTVVGDHFAQKDVIFVSCGRWLVAKTKTDKKGHFVLAFRVPLLSLPGFALVKAIDVNKKQSASASFRVMMPRPSASLYPNHGLPGARIAITGKNFTHHGRIIILFSDPSSNISGVGITVGRINASASGTISTRFTVPRIFKRKHLYSLQVLDIQAGHSISFNFTVK